MLCLSSAGGEKYFASRIFPMAYPIQSQLFLQEVQTQDHCSGVVRLPGTSGADLRSAYSFLPCLKPCSKEGTIHKGLQCESEDDGCCCSDYFGQGSYIKESIDRHRLRRSEKMMVIIIFLGIAVSMPADYHIVFLNLYYGPGDLIPVNPCLKYAIYGGYEVCFSCFRSDSLTVGDKIESRDKNQNKK